MTTGGLKGTKFQLGPSFWAVFSVLVLASLLRLIPHPPNFSPIGALALFGGAYLVHPLAALALPVLVLFLTDYVLGFHDQMAAVYLSVILVSVLGFGMRTGKTSAKQVVTRSLLGSVLFFVITNFAVWYQSGFYPMTLDGLTQCYILALPFFQNSILGDLVYTGAFFGGWALLRRALKVKASHLVKY